MSVRRRTHSPAVDGTRRGPAAGADDRAGASHRTAPTRRPRSDRYEGRHSGPAETDAVLRRSGTAPDRARPLRFALRDDTKLQVPEASGIADLGGGLLAVIDDEKGVYLASEDGRAHCAAHRRDDPRLRDLEGLCRSPDGKGLLVVREGTGEVLRLPVLGRGADRTLGEAESLGCLPMLNAPGANKGWEGLDVLPGRFFADGRDRLVAVNEGEPRRVGLFTLPGLQQEQLLKLPAAARRHAADLSDVAVDPRTGHLLLLSDQSESVLELRLVQRRTLAPGALLDSVALELLQVTRLDVKKGAKPEGLDVTADGELLLCTDEKARLYRFAIQR